MIELLVSYIEARGFTVHVFPGVLVIYKIVNGQRCGVDWSITQVELAQAHKENLLCGADHYMRMIDTAIATREILN